MATSVSLHFTEQGQGAPLVLLHGFPFNGALWAEQVRALNDHHRVITPDLRGHGQSPAPEGTYGMDTIAADVLRLLDHQGIDKAAIMGHSMGGYVTLALWRLAPERFSAMGLICTHAWADTPEVRANRENQAHQVFVHGSSYMAEAMMPRLFAPNAAPDESYIEVARSMILGTRPIGIMGALRGMAARPDSSGLLPGIGVPVLVVAGDSDAIIPLHRAEAMAQAIPNATLVTIENAGHMPMLEQPQATALAIRNFLNELNPFR